MIYKTAVKTLWNERKLIGGFANGAKRSEAKPKLIDRMKERIDC